MFGEKRKRISVTKKGNLPHFLKSTALCLLCGGCDVAVVVSVEADFF